MEGAEDRGGVRQREGIWRIYWGMVRGRGAQELVERGGRGGRDMAECLPYKHGSWHAAIHGSAPKYFNIVDDFRM